MFYERKVGAINDERDGAYDKLSCREMLLKRFKQFRHVPFSSKVAR